MLFNSSSFIFYFLPVVLAGYAICGRIGRRTVIAWLAASSIVFYGMWKPKYVLVLLGSICLNYCCAWLIARAEKRPRLATFWMVAGITANLGALAYFKYLFRFLVFMNQAQVTHQQWHSILLPLGISFFTFTQIAYLVDLRQGEAEPQDIFSYSLFVTFFPHLIAGPILHHREMMPQFLKERFRINWDDVALGLSWFVLGLAKKVLIADRIAPFADQLFAHPGGASFSTAWLGALNYSMQLYFDFSGYSDMAIGLARMFSIRFPYNFNSPYKAASIVDFWQRWHMTLTRYLTMYIYNPISLSISRRRLAAGKRVSRKATQTLSGFSSMVAFPTLSTMFLAGIWHGAGFQFLIFGILHGVYITINHGWRIFRSHAVGQPDRPGIRAIYVLLTFLSVLIAQVFFRANSTRDGLSVIASMAGVHGLRIAGFTGDWKPLAVFALFPVVWFLPNTQEIMGQVEAASSRLSFMRWKPTWRWSVSLGLLFLLILTYINYSSSFLYFQF